MLGNYLVAGQMLEDDEDRQLVYHQTEVGVNFVMNFEFH